MTEPSEPSDFRQVSNPAPAICRRELGRHLRHLREARSLRLEDASATLGVAPSTLSRIETGLAPTRTSYLYLLLNFYEHTDEAQRKQLADLARQGQRKEWWHEYADLLPPGAGRYLSLEPAASKIRSYEQHLIPDLLQTKAYAAAAIRATQPGLSKNVIGKLTAITLRRQQVIRDHGRELHVILDESALLRQIADPATMRDQLNQLREATTNPNVTIQIATLNQPGPAPTCSFTILSFDGPADLDIVSYQSPRGQIVSNHAAEIEAARATFDQPAITRLVREDLVHYLSALSQRRPDLMPVHQLGSRGPVMAH